MELLKIKAKSLKLTDAQFTKLCLENNEIRFERDKNKNIIIMAPTGFEVHEFEGSIFYEIKKWNIKSCLGYVEGTNGGFYLPDSSMRMPDVSWIKKERIDELSAEEKSKIPYLCPDFIVEVVSESDTLKHQHEKMGEWITNGIRLGWLVDYKQGITYIYKPDAEIVKKSFDEFLYGEDVLPGFKLKLSKLVNN
jgi:Uma2 family endonuclease